MFLNNLAISFLIPSKSLKFSSSCSLQNASPVSPYSGFNQRKSYKCLKASRLHRWKIFALLAGKRIFPFFFISTRKFHVRENFKSVFEVKLETRERTRKDSIDKSRVLFLTSFLVETRRATCTALMSNMHDTFMVYAALGCVIASSLPSFIRLTIREGGHFVAKL